MMQTLVKKLKRWKAAAAALPLFLALPTLGSAQTSNGPPPTVVHPSPQTSNGAPPTVVHPSPQTEAIPAGPVPAGPLPAWPDHGGPTESVPAGPGCRDGNANCPGPDEHGLFEAIRGSIFGHYDSSCHTPLGLGNFSEGWLDPFIPVGAGSSGALRGGWVNAPAGFFRREFDQLYSYTQGHHNAPDEHIGESLLFLPLSRRLEGSIFVPYVDSLDPGSTSFGDIFVAARVMLIENKDLGVTSGMTVRTPTGNKYTNNGRTDLDPFAEVWADIGNAWQVRGGLDVDVPVDRNALPGLPDAVLTVSLAVGKTFQSPLGEFTPYLATNFHETFNRGNIEDRAEYDLTPGLRVQLTKGEILNTFLVWGITIPVTGPRPFDTNNQFILVMAW
jgi:hypothetical protein